MKYVLIILLMTNFVVASCNSGQININSASLSKLDELDGIGKVKAQAIIDGRDFASVDDLINVHGIGEVTLDKIKNQGLACVEGENKNENKNEIKPPVLKDPVSHVSSTKSVKPIELHQDDGGVVIYESKESIVLRYLPYVLCIILLIVIIILTWQRF